VSSIKLAVIGTGLIGQKHLEIISANADCELVAVEKHRHEVKSNDPLTAQLAHFCQVIQGEEPPLVSGQDGLKTLATTLAVLESARCHLPISPDVLH
jgi:predicted dehydrogenase